MVEKKVTARKLIKVLKQRYGGSHGAVSRESSNPFQVLVSCVLSQRTLEENTQKATRKLFKVARTPRAILKIPDKEMQELIKEAGFYRQKTKNIKSLSRMILKDYGGRVPDTREELMKLPGVGYKTADVTLCYGFGESTIPVDTHVNVISKRLGLVPQNAHVEEVREALELLVSKKDQELVNRGMVNFGREICRTVKPHCGVCPLNHSCHYYSKIKRRRINRS